MIEIKPQFLRLFFIVILITLSFLKGLSQTDIFLVDSLVYSDKVYRNDVKSVRLGISNTPFSYPILSLRSRSTFELKFDLLSDEFHDFAYTIVHCDENWKVSNISQYDYFEGFFENTIDNFSHSVNTVIGYIHYSLKFPNEDVQLKLSGNYVIIVYEEGNPSNIVLTRKFMIVDDKINVEARYRRPDQIDFYDSGQEIDIEILTAGTNVIDPYNYLEVQVLQNLNWYTLRKFTQPTFIDGNSIKYSFNDKNIFEGLKEFRYFDIRSLRYNTLKVKHIEFIHPYYYVDLQPDEIRTYKPYLYNEDFNGRYSVDIQEYNDDEFSADYARVVFKLESQLYDTDGDIYIAGAFNNWQFNQVNKMSYSFDNYEYTAEILLKQGYYNYLYAYIPHDSNIPEFSYLEGSSYETENDYQVLIYFRDPAERYTQLVGYKLLNTLERK